MITRLANLEQRLHRIDLDHDEEDGGQGDPRGVAGIRVNRRLERGESEPREPFLNSKSDY